MIETKRPEPTYPPPDGHVHVAKVDPAWRLESGKRCRLTVGPGHASCKAPSVAALNRGRYHRGRRVDSWWAYCGDHLFGRWIEVGQVMHWIVEPAGGSCGAEEPA